MLDPFVRRFIRASLLWLGFGVVLGVWMALAPAAVAYRRDISVLIGGMCETDYSGYPDCLDNTLKALQVAVSLGLDAPMTIETPLMWLDKAQTWALANQIGGETLVKLTIDVRRRPATASSARRALP